MTRIVSLLLFDIRSSYADVNSSKSIIINTDVFCRVNLGRLTSNILLSLDKKTKEIRLWPSTAHTKLRGLQRDVRPTSARISSVKPCPSDVQRPDWPVVWLCAGSWSPDPEKVIFPAACSRTRGSQVSTCQFLHCSTLAGRRSSQSVKCSRSFNSVPSNL